MPSTPKTVLCRYHYDALDRMAACSPAGVDDLQRFYQNSRLTTLIQGQIQRSILLTEEQLLAQLTTQNGQTSGALLATDQQRSVLSEMEATQGHAFAYTPYGFRRPHPDLPGFNGEQADPVTGHYLLGNGYRAFNPLLMRFNSPDSLSPFGQGGLNAYAYCAGDPVNRVDPTGHTWGWVKLILRAAKIMNKSPTGPTLDSAQRVSISVSKSVANPAAMHRQVAAPSLPGFFKELPQPKNVPPHLRTTARRLPPVPKNGRLHTQWSETNPSPQEFHIYHLPSGVARTVKRVESVPAFVFKRVPPPTRILPGRRPMDTIEEIYETAGLSLRQGPT